MEEDGKEEQPRHIISKTAEEISCIRTAMKGDGVLRKLSEAQLNALINEFDELKVRVSTAIYTNLILSPTMVVPVSTYCISRQEGYPSKVAPNTTIVQEGSLNYTDRNKLRRFIYAKIHCDSF